MGYIARQIITNNVYYSKGANKISDKIGCNYSTITKFYQNGNNKGVDKVINGYIVSKTVDVQNQNRGFNTNFLV